MRVLRFAAIAAVLGLLAVAAFYGPNGARAADEPAADQSHADGAAAYFAGGCFWCVEADFEKLDGVVEVVSGYTGGLSDNPTYEQVTYGDTGHYEAVKVIYDPTAIGYRALVDYFFRHIDPTDPDGQFCDRGASYRTAIFAATAEEREAALAGKAAAQEALGQEVVTPVVDFERFWIAESYHQDYYKKNPLKYAAYRRGCGRDRRVRQLWGERG